MSLTAMNICELPGKYDMNVIVIIVFKISVDRIYPPPYLCLKYTGSFGLMLRLCYFCSIEIPSMCILSHC